jgi:hypothetical protein
MAVRLGQLLLPWLPEGAIEIAPGIGVVPDGMAAARRGCTGWRRMHGVPGTGRAASWPRCSWRS